MNTKIEQTWYSGKFCPFVMFGYDKDLQRTEFERIDFYPDFTQVWGATGSPVLCAVLPRWMTSEQ